MFSSGHLGVERQVPFRI